MNRKEILNNLWSNSVHELLRFGLVKRYQVEGLELMLKNPFETDDKILQRIKELDISIVLPKGENDHS